MATEYGRAVVTLLDEEGQGHVVRALVPLTRRVREAGLKGVPWIPSGSGMLFRFGVLAPVRMTMDGVHIPLDMVFMNGAGYVLQVYSAIPGEDVIEAPRRTRWVLELPAGWLQRHRIDMCRKARIQT